MSEQVGGEVQAPINPEVTAPLVGQTPPVGGLGSQIQAPAPEPVTPPQVEDPKITGGFNDGLPPELQGNTHIEGLVKIAKAQFPKLDLDRVISKAWETGDPNYLDINYLREVTGEFADNYASYFKDVVEGYQESITYAQEELATKTYESVGGKEVWDRVVSVFNTNADPEQLQFVKGLLDSKSTSQNQQGIEYIKQMGKLYGALPVQGRQLAPVGVSTPAMSGQGLSAKQFQEATAQLHREGKYNNENMEALRQARMLGASQGL